MKGNLMKILFIILMVSISGCASMLNGTEQDLTIKTHDQAEIFIDNRFVGKGYTKRKVSRDQAHEVRVVKGDCQQTFTTQSTFNKTTLLGLFIDAGLISIPSDFISGAAWNVHPNKIKLMPNCTPNKDS